MPGDVLRDGTLELEGRMPWSSNATFLARVCLDGAETHAVYKPGRGERPLWDFPAGVFRREIAAYELSRALGWDIVPRTILRDDAPLGEGSLQQFVDADFEQHYFTLLDDERHHDALRHICVFDLISNNTDRKSGHVLIDDERHLWAIDNGLSFHREFKLRTVIWDFAGEPIRAGILDDVARLLDSPLPDPVITDLDPFERDALTTRARAVLTSGRFPTDVSGRGYPWPLV